MKRSSKAILAAIMVFMLFSSVNSFAGDPVRKLGRGVANTALGALEIPICGYDTNKEEGGIAAWTGGLFKGIARFFAREGVGILEILTFPMPLPGCMDDPREAGWGYGPIMRPEWIVDEDHDIYNTVYPDTAVMR